MHVARPSIARSGLAACELRRYRGDHGAHVHAHAQVLFGANGCLEVEVEGRLMRIDASAGLIVPAGALHGSSSRHGAEVWVIDLPADAPAAPDFARVRPFSCAAGRPQGVATARWLDYARAAPRASPRRRIDVALLERTVAAALHEDWSAARMAAQFALSVPQFHARWRTLTGQTPQAWLRERRLDAAERLLRSGRSAEAVAARVGYAGASALLYALRRERGIGARGLRGG